MKKTILLLSTILVTLFLNGQKNSSNAQSSEHALSISGSMFFKTKYNNRLTLSSFNYHYSWQNKKKSTLYNNVNIGIGKLIPNPSEYMTVVVLDYSLSIKKKNHFFEIGAGIIADDFLMHLNLGYKYHFRNHILFRAVLMPSSYFIAEQMGGGASEKRNLLFLNFSLGYRFGQKATQAISNTTNYFFNHLEFQLFSNLLSFSERIRIKPTYNLMVNYKVYKKNKNSFHFGIGMGNIGSYHFNISYLYGNKYHYLETSLNLFSATLNNPNNNINYSRYRLFQPQIGYRYQCQKIPIFARIAYAPYIRALNWRREGGLHHNMVMGVGYRFHK